MFKYRSDPKGMVYGLNRIYPQWKRHCVLNGVYPHGLLAQRNLRFYDRFFLKCNCHDKR